MSLFGTPSQMLCTALGRASEDGNGEGEREEEVRDEAPTSVGGELDAVNEESVGRNTVKF
jgi:hypothetical protein